MIKCLISVICVLLDVSILLNKKESRPDADSTPYLSYKII